MKTKSILVWVIICVLAVTAVGLYTGYEEKKEELDRLKQNNQVQEDIVKSFSTEMEEKDQQIVELTDAVEEKDRKIQDLTDDLEEMKEQVTALEDGGTLSAEEIKTLTADVSSRESKIVELEAAVSEKDGRIAELEAAGVEKDSKIEALEAAAAEKDSKIEQLESSVSAAQEQIDALNTDLAEKAQSIEMLNADVLDKNSRIETLTVESVGTKENEQTVQDLKTELADKEKTVQDLNASIVEKDTAIEGLKEEIRSLQAQLGDDLQTQEKGVEETTGRAVTRPSIKMDFDKYKLSGPEKISVVVTVTNTGEEDMNEPVTLYYPDGKQVEEFGENGLSAGKSRSWIGEWDVTQEQLDKGDVTFSVRYAIYDGEPDKDGLPALRQHKMNFSKKILQTKK